MQSLKTMAKTTTVVLATTMFVLSLLLSPIKEVKAQTTQLTTQQIEQIRSLLLILLQNPTFLEQIRAILGVQSLSTSSSLIQYNSPKLGISFKYLNSWGNVTDYFTYPRNWDCTTLSCEEVELQFSALPGEYYIYALNKERIENIPPTDGNRFKTIVNSISQITRSCDYLSPGNQCSIYTTANGLTVAKRKVQPYCSEIGYCIDRMHTYYIVLTGRQEYPSIQFSLVGSNDNLEKDFDLMVDSITKY